MLALAVPRHGIRRTELLPDDGPEAGVRLYGNGMMYDPSQYIKTIMSHCASINSDFFHQLGELQAVTTVHEIHQNATLPHSECDYCVHGGW